MSELQLYVDGDFEGLSKDDLRALCKKHGVKTPPAAGEDWMRRALRQVAAGAKPETIDPPKADNVVSINDMPNLTPNGRWGGRRHIVSAVNNTGDAAIKGVTVHWEGVPEDLLFDVPKSIGEPWFNVIRTSKTTLHSIKTVTDADNSKRIVLIETQVPSVQVNYLGVDPETAHLPGSLLEYYRNLAREKSNFARYRRRALVRILSELRPEIGDERVQKMEDADIRYLVLQFLGPEFSMGEGDELADEEAG